MPKRQDSAHRLKKGACTKVFPNCRLGTVHRRRWKSRGEDSLLSLIREGPIRARNNEIDRLAAYYLRKQLQCNLAGILSREERLPRVRVGNLNCPISAQQNCRGTLAEN